MRLSGSESGNSQVPRAPRALDLRRDDHTVQEVNSAEERTELIVDPAAPIFLSEDLVANQAPEAMRDAFDWGDDSGRERVED
jgi:antitoxin MazE